MTTTFLPSAWVDDELIAERKIGLAQYIFDLLSDPKYKDKTALSDFLSSPDLQRDMKFDPEDALPSTFARKEAMAIAATLGGGADTSAAAAASFLAGGYYPDWAVGTNPPEKLDFSKFDLIYFGMFQKKKFIVAPEG